MEPTTARRPNLSGDQLARRPSRRSPGPPEAGGHVQPCPANGWGTEEAPRVRRARTRTELSQCVRVCVRACVCAFVHVHVCACVGACMLACVLYNLLHSSSKSKAASARIEAGRILSGIRSTTLYSCLGPPTAGLTKDLFGWVSISCGIESSTLSSVFVVIHPPGEDNFPFFRSHRNLGRGGQTPKRAVNDWAVHRCDILNDD